MKKTLFPICRLVLPAFRRMAFLFVAMTVVMRHPNPCKTTLAADISAPPPSAYVETFTLATAAPNNRVLEFAVRLPIGFSPERAPSTRVLVVFGGRNWDARRTLSTYDFNDFADQHNVVLLAPAFRDDNYWQPEAWSGEALVRALSHVRERHGIPDHAVFLYGYSAGGQCANLFYAWMPEHVAAWGAHACGVFFDPAKLFSPPSPSTDDFTRYTEIVAPPDASVHPRPAPALVTCGVKDEPRRAISRHFLNIYREAGGESVWRDYSSGHEFISDPVKLAGEFFASLLATPNASPVFVGDDDTDRYYPADSRAARRIPEELRSLFREEVVARLWQRQSPGEW